MEDENLRLARVAMTQFTGRHTSMMEDDNGYPLVEGLEEVPDEHALVIARTAALVSIADSLSGIRLSVEAGYRPPSE